ncbi:MAG: DUF448 domain-containing protein [Robiginitomaculum sp.]
MKSETTINTDENPEQIDSHGHKPKERKDIASGQNRDPKTMVRLAFASVGPNEKMVVADLSCKVPGRGAWVVANRQAVERAIKTDAIARAAKAKVDVPDGFSDLIEKQLSMRVIALLGMTNRAGELETGFDKVRSAASGGKLAFRFEARDGAPDGRAKIRVITKALAKEYSEDSAPVIGCFTSQELGKIIGRDHVVHVGVRKGHLAKTIYYELSRLYGFRALIPSEWPDKSHEVEFIPFGQDTKGHGK